MMFRSLSFLLFFTCFQLDAASVWKVSYGPHHLYLGGTIHLLTAQDYPLPSAYDEAYAQSDILVFETDMEAVASPAFSQRVNEVMIYPHGQSIASELSPATMDRLRQYAIDNNIPIDTITSLRPSMLALTLTMIELQQLGFNQQGVDAHFFGLAQADNKPRHWLESADQQLSFLAALGEQDPDRYINYTLDEIAQSAKVVNRLKSAWLQGDLQAMENLELAKMRRDYPRVYQKLIKQRNDAWLQRIPAMLETIETEYILVGALHLAGPDGLISQLQARGFGVSRLH